MDAAFASLGGVPITELRIEGLRTIEKVRLGLGGLTVLIGDNGTGKSSILEACEILRLATGPRFLDELYGIHGGLTALLRQGARRLRLGITLVVGADECGPPRPGLQSEGYSRSIDYDLTLVPQGAFASIEEDIHIAETGLRLRQGSRRLAAHQKVCVLKRRGDEVAFPIDRARTEVDARSSYLATKHGVGAEGMDDWGAFEAYLVFKFLRHAAVHLPFETLPAWAARALDRKSALRASALLTPADSLEKLGLNLASSYHALKNNFGRAHWDSTLEYIRIGLGERIEDVVTWADPGGGNIGLSIKLIGLDRPIPLAQLSDGMLSYLGFAALFRLHATKPSLVAFDEPDLHLHPQLLMRVLDMFASMAREYPVLLATHSDRLLDALPDPARSVVLCELDERGTTRLVRPDPEALAKWLERYRGLGDIRGAGHAASVLTKVEPTE